jgi:hypothetical protein
MIVSFGLIPNWPRSCFVATKSPAAGSLRRADQGCVLKET